MQPDATTAASVTTAAAMRTMADDLPTATDGGCMVTVSIAGCSNRRRCPSGFGRCGATPGEVGYTAGRAAASTVTRRRAGGLGWPRGSPRPGDPGPLAPRQPGTNPSSGESDPAAALLGGATVELDMPRERPRALRRRPVAASTMRMAAVAVLPRLLRDGPASQRDENHRWAAAGMPGGRGPPSLQPGVLPCHADASGPRRPPGTGGNLR